MEQSKQPYEYTVCYTGHKDTSPWNKVNNPVTTQSVVPDSKDTSPWNKVNNPVIIQSVLPDSKNTSPWNKVNNSVNIVCSTVQ